MSTILFAIVVVATSVFASFMAVWLLCDDDTFPATVGDESSPSEGE